MEIQLVKDENNVKISGKTKTELLQAMANLMRQNIKGCYDEKIILYSEALKRFSANQVITKIHQSSPEEMYAIMHFNKDRRFAITE